MSTRKQIRMCDYKLSILLSFSWLLCAGCEKGSPNPATSQVDHPDAIQDTADDHNVSRLDWPDNHGPILSPSEIKALGRRLYVHLGSVDGSLGHVHTSSRNQKPFFSRSEIICYVSMHVDEFDTIALGVGKGLTSTSAIRQAIASFCRNERKSLVCVSSGSLKFEGQEDHYAWVEVRGRTRFSAP